MARLPRTHPGIPYELDRYLTPAEKIVFRTRLHPIRIVRPWLLFVVILLLAGGLGSVLPRNNGGVRGALFFVSWASSRGRSGAPSSGTGSGSSEPTGA